MHPIVGKAGFAVSAAALLVVNKLAVYEIPLPSLICMLQLSWTVAFVLLLISSSMVEVRSLQLATVVKYLPWVLAFVATMYTSMMALYAANVDTVIVFRCLSPIIISFLEWLWFDRQLPDLKSWMAMCVMLGAAICYVWLDQVFRIDGFHAYAWVTAYVACDVTSTLLGRHLVATSVKLPTWDHVLHANLLSLPPMLVAGFVGGEPATFRHIHWTDAGLSWVGLSCVLAVSISYFGWCGMHAHFPAHAPLRMDSTPRILPYTQWYTSVNPHSLQVGSCRDERLRLLDALHWHQDWLECPQLHYLGQARFTCWLERAASVCCCLVRLQLAPSPR